MKKSRRIALIALNIALAFVLSFLESLIPINFGIPGLKVGLANLVVVAAVYMLPKRDAFFISMVRILIAGLVFSGAFSLLYSFAGGILSFAVMLLAQKNKHLSIVGVSILGAAVHNVGQIIVAALVMQTYRIVYYLPVLLISGAAAGAAVGLISGIIVNRLANIKVD
ncbi:MAG: Gx transporter family protein [Eubacterium sp.]